MDFFLIILNVTGDGQEIAKSVNPKISNLY